MGFKRYLKREEGEGRGGGEGVHKRGVRVGFYRPPGREGVKEGSGEVQKGVQKGIQKGVFGARRRGSQNDSESPNVLCGPCLEIPRGGVGGQSEARVKGVGGVQGGGFKRERRG